jgi:hypothetical protein
MQQAKTEYVRSGDIHIAYQAIGDGPPDLVYVQGWVSHVELAWEEPTLARFLRCNTIEIGEIHKKYLQKKRMRLVIHFADRIVIPIRGRGRTVLNYPRWNNSKH